MKPSQQPLLSIQNISKAYPGVQALLDVSFEVMPGEVHALVGENGAGKSTLMKILAGVHRPDSGQVIWQGRPLNLHNPADAQHAGISIIFQEFNLLPDLTVGENLLLNYEPRNRLGLIDWKQLHHTARALLARLETEIDTQRLVRTLSVAQQQLVEIAKALAFSAQLIIMDEPTAALNLTEVEHLYNVVNQLVAQGCAVIFISHRLDEVLDISQRVTVLKDGQWVDTRPTAELNREDIVRMMVGRDLTDIFPARQPVTATETLLSAEGLQTATLRDIHLSLRPGEIVGLAGLEGQGQRELARALFGLERITGGIIRIAGRAVRLRHPQAAIGAGIAFISDDRKQEGLALRLSVRDNISMPNLGQFSNFGLMRYQQEQLTVRDIVKALDVRTPSIEQEVRLLSGGNQQKSVLAKWLIARPRILIFAEPTRGVDVGAKVEIYHLIHRLAQEGAAVLMVSSELLELIGMSHRILVMREGAIVAELPGEDMTEERIMLAATGVQ